MSCQAPSALPASGSATCPAARSSRAARSTGRCWWTPTAEISWRAIVSERGRTASVSSPSTRRSSPPGGGRRATRWRTCRASTLTAAASRQAIHHGSSRPGRRSPTASAATRPRSSSASRWSPRPAPAPAGSSGIRTGCWSPPTPRRRRSSSRRSAARIVWWSPTIWGARPGCRTRWSETLRAEALAKEPGDAVAPDDDEVAHPADPAQGGDVGLGGEAVRQGGDGELGTAGGAVGGEAPSGDAGEGTRVALPDDDEVAGRIVRDSGALLLAVGLRIDEDGAADGDAEAVEAPGQDVGPGDRGRLVRLPS